MDRRRRLEAAIIVFAVMLPTIAAVGTNCTVRTTGKSGQLICQFSTNISEGQYDFLVQRYNLDGTNQQPEIVVNCRWFMRIGLDCDVIQGYVFDKKVWNMLIIDIPALSQKHEGRYMCQVLDEDNVKNEDNTCEYKYTGGKAATTPNTTPAITNTVQNDEKSAPEDHTKSILAIVIILSVIVLVDMVVRYIITGKLSAKLDKVLDSHRFDKNTSIPTVDDLVREIAKRTNAETDNSDGAIVDLMNVMERDPLTSDDEI